MTEQEKREAIAKLTDETNRMLADGGYGQIRSLLDCVVDAPDVLPVIDGALVN